MKRVEIGDFDLELSVIPFEYDFILSLPVLKSHSIVGFTGALKNQFGFFSTKERIKLHLGVKNIYKGIAEINRIVKSNFYIVDAIETLTFTNEVRHGGKKTNLGYMLAGSDPVELDVAGFELLRKVEKRLKNKSYEDIPYLKYAVDRGIGNPCYEVKDIF